MFGMDVKTFFDAKPVLEATDKAALRILDKRSAAIERDVKASIRTSDEPSPEGTPPHTRGKSGQNLRDSVQRAFTKDEALIGPSFAEIGLVGEAMEFGKEFRGEQFDERPFMGPMLEQHIPMFAQDWAGSI